jgi:hypothetical protein
MTIGTLGAIVAAREAVGERAMTVLDIVFVASKSVSIVSADFQNAMREFPSPMAFSHGVNNAPSYFLRSELQLPGRSVTIVGGAGAAMGALTLACAWRTARPDVPVLVVGSSEVHPCLYPAHDRFGTVSPSHREGGAILGDGAAAILLGDEGMPLTIPFSGQLDAYDLVAAPRISLPVTQFVSAANGSDWDTEERSYLEDRFPGDIRSLKHAIGELFGAGPLAQIAIAQKWAEESGQAVGTHGFSRPGQYGLAQVGGA